MNSPTMPSPSESEPDVATRSPEIPAERPGRTGRRAPGATYRLQFGRAFTFSDATRIVEYLAALGVTDLYASPLLAARSGSTHGYDVTDPTRLNADLGSEEDFRRLCETMLRHGMALLLDFVPNHMCVACNDNRFWEDVLRNGRKSQYSRWFDVYWDESERFLVPLLGRKLEDVLADGELELVRDGESWFLSYFEQRFPLSDEASALVEQSLATTERGHPTTEASKRLATPVFLQRLLALLPYRLVHWRTAERRPGYRRFFTINELIGLRIEDPEVFRVVHQKAFELISAGCVDGLRIDHIDGLRLPLKYLSDLQEACSDLLPNRRPLYVVVEKILGDRERLPEDWPVDGTTGYEFLNAVLRVFVHTDGAEEIRRVYADFTGQRERFETVARAAKLHVLSTSLRGDAERLIARIAGAVTGVSRDDLERAFVAVLVHLRVYRTYWEPARPSSEQDRRQLATAFDDARAANDDVPAAAFEALWNALLGGRLEERLRSEFVLRFQQLSGPAAAKGIEDTALYRYVPLAALNEVGGDPDASGMTAAEFHAFNRERLRWPGALSATSTHDTKRGEDVRLRIAGLSEIPGEWAAALNEFRRALDVPVHELPDAVDEYLFYQTVLGTLPAPEEEGLEDASSRIEEYMIKAVREAHLRTSWQKPDEAYEQKVMSFGRRALSNASFLRAVRRLLVPVATAGLYSSAAQVVLKVASPGVPDFYQGAELLELSLVDPDNRRPVDFDRRRMLLHEVDEALRVDPCGAFRSWLTTPGDERLKLAVIRRSLALRARHLDIFDEGLYVPLHPSGVRANHVVAFARVRGREGVLVVVARWYLSLGAPPQLPIGPLWQGATVRAPKDVPAGEYRDAFTGKTIRTDGSSGSTELSLEQLFAHLPVALLERLP